MPMQRPRRLAPTSPVQLALRRAALLAALAVLSMTSACKTLHELENMDKPVAIGGAQPGRSQAVAPPVGPFQPTEMQDPEQAIVRYEAARSDGGGFLQYQLARGEERTRERAALALGRLPFPEHNETVTNALVTALGDPSARVRAAAAFAIGERADHATASALVTHAQDPEALVRARVVEAASRIDEVELAKLVLAALDDPAAIVRREAMLAPLRWARPKTSTLPPPKGPPADEVDRLLVEHLVGGVPRTDAPAPSAETDALARANALFALARRASPRAREACLAGLASNLVIERIFAAQGLAKIPMELASENRLREALSDPDWRVVCEAAIALKAHADPASMSALAGLMTHASAHVRRAACEALGAFKDQRENAKSVLEKARSDVSPSVRAAAIASGAKLFGDACAAELELRVMDREPLVRAGAAIGAAELSDALAVPLLLRLAQDANLRVAGLAIDGLGSHLTPAARMQLYSVLESGDNGLRIEAVQALRKNSLTEDLPHLGACYAQATGDISTELAYEILKSAADKKISGEKASGEEARKLLVRGCGHPNAFVRSKARTLFAQAFPALSVPPEVASRAHASSGTLAPKDLPAGGPNPQVELSTNRGKLVFELFPDEAPLHVHNFLELVRSGYYNGLPFHRVELDFVVQGGDYRGDGNGGKTWNGEPLPAEFGPRKFVRGSLGMPRNEDFDSGGSQIFVTHRETPHLDGLYTLFGELRSGFEALDQLEVGDVIREARILPAH